MTREFHFFHFAELHSDNSINDRNNLFENYIPKCYKVKRILISFNCFSEYSSTDNGLLTRFMPTKYHHFACFRLAT